MASHSQAQRVRSKLCSQSDHGEVREVENWLQVAAKIGAIAFICTSAKTGYGVQSPDPLAANEPEDLLHGVLRIGDLIRDARVVNLTSYVYVASHDVLQGPIAKVVTDNPSPFRND